MALPGDIAGYGRQLVIRFTLPGYLVKLLFGCCCRQHITMGQVYIIHFSQRLSNRARHYVGFVYGDSLADVKHRFREHVTGQKNGAKIIKAALAAGISLKITRIYHAVDMDIEKRIKRQKNTWKHCPVCRLERAQGKQLKIKFSPL